MSAEPPAPAAPSASPGAKRLVVVTGMSGAGRTTCLKMLEDLGFEAVDNLPLPYAERLLRAEADLERDLAIGLDTRTRGFEPGAISGLLAGLRAAKPYKVDLVFFDCDDEVLLRRYTETRRLHPMAADRPVSDGIARERELLAGLRAEADLLIDTTGLVLPLLRGQLNGVFGRGERDRLNIQVVSFAFRGGLPRAADLVFDVRFLRNPHYDADLQPLTGLDPRVQAYVSADEGWPAFFENLVNLLEPLLPRYQREGKAYLTVAIGCTGGKHRSVFTAEALAVRLKAGGWEVRVSHREREAGRALSARDAKAGARSAASNDGATA